MSSNTKENSKNVSSLRISNPDFVLPESMYDICIRFAEMQSALRTLLRVVTEDEYIGEHELNIITELAKSDG